jgi:uncharacterized protein YqgV (UPF0045/DUF77 family)
MALRVEFTVEPFTEGSPGPHVDAAVAAASEHAVDVEFGPFGTSISGATDDVLTALDAAVRAAVAAGATKVSVQIAVEP